mgnify:CR=1 FL=1
MKIKPDGNIFSRFFDNRADSLIKQLPDLVKTHAGSIKRNYLGIGSGFYEGGNSTNKMPKVVSEIETVLKEAGLLIKEPEKDIYVNPMNCQAISSCIDILEQNSWIVRPAFDALCEGNNHQQQRLLHAKFIFSAKGSSTSDECKSSWLYLGSGNLTSPGFLNKASLNGGNLEAGILFSPKDLNWFGEENTEQCISNKLPINWDDERIITDTAKLCAGDEMPEHDSQFLAAPVSYFTLSIIDEATYALKPCFTDKQDYQVWFADGEACQMENDLHIWPSPAPRQVKVSWLSDKQILSSYVPVFDEFGRLAATPLPEIEIDDAWGLVGAFPVLPNDSGDDNQPPDDSGVAEGSIKPNAGNSDYHINKMMQLIEHIAQKQTAIDAVNWAQWCYRLEQVFCLMGKSEAIQYFQGIKVNPISPLWAKPFRPDFAEDTHSDAGRLYEELLCKIEMTLKLTDLLKLGGEDE